MELQSPVSAAPMSRYLSRCDSVEYLQVLAPTARCPSPRHLLSATGRVDGLFHRLRLHRTYPSPTVPPLGIMESLGICSRMFSPLPFSFGSSHYLPSLAAPCNLPFHPGWSLGGDRGKGKGSTTLVGAAPVDYTTSRLHE